jgi:N6-L-threonylcarbamoyladenine synthase
MLVLGIETSCDETGAAIVDDAGLVRSDVVQSQIALHAPYGGVVPELASRDHMRAITLVIEQSLSAAGARLDNVEGIAVTARPGLSGALLVGVQAAKGLAWARDLPVVAVDHLVGHLLAVYLRRAASDPAGPAYPFVALLASGGHTAIYRVDGPGLSEIRELGATRDDAAGEAFDKVAKAIGLGYPGGPIIDRLAAGGDASRFPIPLPMARADSLEFSFSGLKSFVARHIGGARRRRGGESRVAPDGGRRVRARGARALRAAVQELHRQRGDDRVCGRAPARARGARRYVVLHCDEDGAGARDAQGRRTAHGRRGVNEICGA